jgi:hypothetical protein
VIEVLTIRCTSLRLGYGTKSGMERGRAIGIGSCLFRLCHRLHGSELPAIAMASQFSGQLSEIQWTALGGPALDRFGSNFWSRPRISFFS